MQKAGKIMTDNKVEMNLKDYEELKDSLRNKSAKIDELQTMIKTQSETITRQAEAFFRIGIPFEAVDDVSKFEVEHRFNPAKLEMQILVMINIPEEKYKLYPEAPAHIG